MRTVPSARYCVSLALLAACAVLLPAGTLSARYIRPVLEMVPVEKLVQNLERIVQKNPKDAQARLNLARVHAMAYASKTEQAQVFKGKEGRGAWFGYEPKHVPFTLAPAKDEAKEKAAKEHLAKAIQRYREV